MVGNGTSTYLSKVIGYESVMSIFCIWECSKKSLYRIKVQEAAIECDKYKLKALIAIDVKYISYIIVCDKISTLLSHLSVSIVNIETVVC